MLFHNKRAHCLINTLNNTAMNFNKIYSAKLRRQSINIIINYDLSMYRFLKYIGS